MILDAGIVQGPGNGLQRRIGGQWDTRLPGYKYTMLKGYLALKTSMLNLSLKALARV